MSLQRAKLVWATPDGENLIAYMARVSNPSNQYNTETAVKLVKYLIKHKHWSPLDMVDACFEIETTRDIARQMLRHRSFYFQEFSQRYAEVQSFDISEARLQDTKNRQNSLTNEDIELAKWWCTMQLDLVSRARSIYGQALKHGVAKEVARKVLPEGLTCSRMYMKGTLRNWIHYLDVRKDASTQKEHRDIANKIEEELAKCFPSVFEALRGDK